MTAISSQYILEELTQKYNRKDIINFNFPSTSKLDDLTTAAQVFTLLSYIYIDYCVTYLKDIIHLALDGAYKRIRMFYDSTKHELLFLPANSNRNRVTTAQDITFTSFGLRAPDNTKDESFMQVFSALNQKNSAAFNLLQYALFAADVQYASVATLTKRRLHWQNRPDYTNLFISERVMPKMLQQASDLLFLHTNIGQEQPKTDAHVCQGKIP